MVSSAMVSSAMVSSAMVSSAHGESQSSTPSDRQIARSPDRYHHPSIQSPLSPHSSSTSQTIIPSRTIPSRTILSRTTSSRTIPSRTIPSRTIPSEPRRPYCARPSAHPIRIPWLTSCAPPHATAQSASPSLRAHYREANRCRYREGGSVSCTPCRPSLRCTHHHHHHKPIIINHHQSVVSLPPFAEMPSLLARSLC